MAHKILIAMPVGFNSQSPDTGDWLAIVERQILAESELLIDRARVHNGRIGMCRNRMVEQAKKEKSTHILFIDPDIVPDKYLATGRCKRFWDEFWPFALAHPGSVLAAPACGPYPKREINVFYERDGATHRMDHDAVPYLQDWHCVSSVGTGLMLIDMSVFDKIEPPYFCDVYTDQYESAVLHSQDGQFCRRISQANVPIWVNFSCWCGHWQNSCVDPPGFEQITLCPD